MNTPAFTPVFLLTGFLGAGKTTLLTRMLDDPSLADSAVLINEFGEIGLDHHLIGRIDETMVLLQSGCLCCTIRGELSSAIKELLSKRDRGLVPPFRRFIVETTGLADPALAIATLSADPVLRHHVRMNSVVTVVDVVNGRDQLATQPESLKQAAVADMLVLTKTDLADQATTDAMIVALRAINPDAPLIDAAKTRFDASEILSERFARGLSGLRCLPAFNDSDSDGNHIDNVRSFVVVLEHPIDWTLFGLWLTMLLNRHGAQLLRVKGILNLIGEDAPIAIHGVQTLMHVPTHLAAWPDDDRRSRIVFIARGIQAAAVTRSLKAFGVLTGDRP